MLVRAVHELVDTERYPIDDLDSTAGQAFLEECRTRMTAESSLTLPGFVRPEAIDAILAEIDGAPRVPNERLRTPYSWMHNLDFPPEHPRRALFRWSNQIITADAFADAGPAFALFSCREVVEFVRRLLGYPSLYPGVCPTLSLMASVLNEGDENGWHFDTNDGVVSILLQAADDGGHFDFAPYLRDESDENYDDVAALFAGQLEPIRLAQTGGTFSLFLGRRSPTPGDSSRVHQQAPRHLAAVI